MRLNRLLHGFSPASLRCLCAMDKESLERLCRTARGHWYGTGRRSTSRASATSSDSASSSPPGRQVPAEERGGGPQHLQPRHHPGARDA